MGVKNRLPGLNTGVESESKCAGRLLLGYFSAQLN
jgi:hypothetical protein